MYPRMSIFKTIIITLRRPFHDTVIYFLRKERKYNHAACVDSEALCKIFGYTYSTNENASIKCCSACYF